jgi:two-component system, cell cycle response regulator CpdR
LIARMLCRDGYDVLASGSAHEALEIVKGIVPVDAVVADILMPGMSGTELIGEIATLSPRTANVLMTAALNDPATVPDDVPVLRKPFSKRELICAVEAALSAKSTSTQI